MRSTPITAFLLLLVSSIHAQSSTEALTAVNTAFAGSVQVKLDRHQQVVFDLYEAGTRIREDIVIPSDLDTTLIHFSVEENAVIIGCRTDKPQCISKEIFKLNTIRLTGRSNLPCPTADPGGEATIKALRQLVTIASQQLAAAGNETRERPQRMK